VHNTLSAIDACCLSVSGIYASFTQALYGEFKKHTSFKVDSLAPKRFYESAIKAQRQFELLMQNQLGNDMSIVESEIDASAKDNFKKTKVETIRRLKIAYRSQMLQDIQTAKLDVLRYTLAVKQKLAEGRSIESSVVGVSKSIQFKFVDRLGRQWNSDRYIAVVTRFELVKSIVFAFELAAISANSTHLLLSNDEVVALSDIEKYSHPNTKAIPVQVVK
jgi:hypothetical protein